MKTPALFILFVLVFVENAAQGQPLKIQGLPLKIVYAKHQVLGGSHYAYTEAVSDAQNPERKDMLGGQLRLLTVKEDGTTDDELLYEAPQDGTLRDPDVSYDAKKIVFSMRTSYTEDDYHLYELDATTRKTRQLTFGKGYADIEPCYTPHNNIVFVSTRCMQITDCWTTEVGNLYTCDSNGQFMRRLTFDQVHDNYPQMLSDGRLTYTRWEYNDRGQVYVQALFSMNNDGTNQAAYYGNNSWFPTSILHARQIPNSSKIAAIASGHHTLQQGKLIIVDRNKGTEEASGIQLIAPVRETKAVKIDKYGQDGDQFQYPLPLDEQNFIVAHLPEESAGKPFGLYWINADGDKKLLASDPKVSCGQPVLLKEREIPMQRASEVDYSQNTGLYYIQDVYFGPGLQGIERGTVKQLRIVALEYRPASIGSNRNVGAAGGAMVSTPPSVTNGSWDVKRVLGTVPVESDGSAYFQVPARTPVYFQLLDAKGFTVQTMRSWTTVQPGERQNCLGCHENKAETKGATASPTMFRGGTLRTLALGKSPRRPVPECGVSPDTGFSFNKYIQPILEKRCVSCHHAEHLAAQVPAADNDIPAFVLTSKIRKDAPDGSLRAFSEAYLNLTNKGKKSEWVNWLDVQSAPPMLLPYSFGSVKSKIVSEEEFPVYMLRRRPKVRDVLLGTKNQPQAQGVLTDEERRLFALWIDLLVPYCGDYEEANTWSDEQKKTYSYYKEKRKAMEKLDRENIGKYIESLPAGR